MNVRLGGRAFARSAALCALALGGGLAAIGVAAQPAASAVCLVKTEPSGSRFRVAAPASQAAFFEQKGFLRFACPASIDQKSARDAAVARCDRLRKEQPLVRARIERLLGISINDVCGAAQARAAPLASN